MYEYRIRADRKQSVAELKAIEARAKSVALLALLLAAFATIVFGIQAWAGTLLSKDRPIVIIVFTGLLVGSWISFGFSRLARKLARERSAELQKRWDRDVAAVDPMRRTSD